MIAYTCALSVQTENVYGFVCVQVYRGSITATITTNITSINANNATIIMVMMMMMRMIRMTIKPTSLIKLYRF